MDLKVGDAAGLDVVGLGGCHRVGSTWTTGSAGSAGAGLRGRVGIGPVCTMVAVGGGTGAGIGAFVGVSSGGALESSSVTRVGMAVGEGRGNGSPYPEAKVESLVVSAQRMTSPLADVARALAMMSQPSTPSCRSIISTPSPSPNGARQMVAGVSKRSMMSPSRPRSVMRRNLGSLSVRKPWGTVGLVRPSERTPENSTKARPTKERRPAA